jgi:hypothetical protein
MPTQLPPEPSLLSLIAAIWKIRVARARLWLWIVLHAPNLGWLATAQTERVVAGGRTLEGCAGEDHRGGAEGAGKRN